MGSELGLGLGLRVRVRVRVRNPNPNMTLTLTLTWQVLARDGDGQVEHVALAHLPEVRVRV